MGQHLSPRYGQVIPCSDSCQLITTGGGGDELVNRSYRDRAGDDLGHRDVTRNFARNCFVVLKGKSRDVAMKRPKLCVYLLML